MAELVQEDLTKLQTVSEKRGRLYELLTAFENLYTRGGSMAELARSTAAA